VLLMSDPNYDVDAIGRRLYYAFTPDGVSIDETLVREGLARAVRTEAAEGSTLEAAEAEASAAGRGCVWGGASTAPAPTE
jgi:endonuclease YncB( thermonuclease family)